MASGAPAFTSLPSSWLVISEFTTISLIGVLTSVSWEGNRANSGKRPSGIR